MSIADLAESAKCTQVNGTSATATKWTYEEAFKRNRGLISEEEQEKLRTSRVAIAGMGGVGGVHLITLARLGIGKFTIADPDVFEVANFNRQYGATISNLGRNKAEAMAEAALDINPELDLRVINTYVSETNIEEFLRDADLYVDGIDLFSIAPRRTIFSECATRGLYAVTVAPMGFSAGSIVFDPQGWTFDKYCDLTDAQSVFEQLLRFIIGICPSALHVAHLNPQHVSIAERSAPSVSAGCQLASGEMASLVFKLLVGRGTIRCAPYYQQFDSYGQRFVAKRLRRGNRNFWQRMKCILAGSYWMNRAKQELSDKDFQSLVQRGD
jgi:molybdopterin/thiamine biosynthesis adenylyltransferase